MRLIASTLRSLGLAALTMVLVISSFAVFAPSAAAATYDVTLGAGGLQFSPKKVSVKPGDTITWKNGMLAPHNVIFNPAKSPANGAKVVKELSHKQLLFKTGESFSTTIPDDAPAGEYEFFCAPHRGAGMVGKIVVEG
ncbi:MAG: plastocyanin [Cyanobacteria bacterium J06635_10]